MTTNAPFIRQIQAQLFTQTEDVGGGPVTQATTVTGNGDRQTLKMSFTVEKTFQSNANESRLIITNLAPATRERLRTSLQRVQLSMGWVNTDLSVIADGALFHVSSRRNGPEYETEIIFYDGQAGMTKGVTTRTFTGGQAINDVLRSLVGDMPGISIGDIDVTGVLGSGGLTVFSRTSEMLDRLGRQYGFTWSVQNGRFQALQDNRSFQNILNVSAANRNLIEVAPLVSGPLQQRPGVRIATIIDPRFRPGDRVNLNSLVNPQLNGTYRAHLVRLLGTTHGDDYLMEIEGYDVS